MKKDISKKYIIIGIILVVLIGIGIWYLVDGRTQSSEEQQAATEERNQEMLERLKEHIILPDEQPAIGEVTDIDALKQKQPFFKDAQNGDFVFIYSGAKKAYVYRPEDDIIVTVGPTVSEASVTEQQAKKDQKKPTSPTENKTEEKIKDTEEKEEAKKK